MAQWLRGAPALAVSFPPTLVRPSWTRCGNGNIIETKRRPRRIVPAPSAPVTSTISFDRVDDLLFHQRGLNFYMPNTNIMKMSTPTTESSGDAPQGASPEQLQFIQNNLADKLPQLFYQSMDYSIYSSNLVFVNNIKGGKTTVGLYYYIKQVALLRTIGHLKYAHVKFEIIKITKKPDDSSVIVRWKVTGVSGLKAIFTLWKFKLWKLQDTYNAAEVWLDGLSYFYVGSDGRIFKHIADKVTPDEENVVANPISKVVAGKLALMLGLAPEGQIFNFYHKLNTAKAKQNKNNLFPLEELTCK